MRPFLNNYVFIAILSVSCACGSKRSLVPLERPFQAECLKELILMNEIQNPEDQEEKVDKDWEVDFPDPRITLMARVLGVSTSLQNYLEESSKEDPDEIKLNSYGRRVERAIQMASFETSAITGGIDCEEEKAEQIANFLEKRIKNKETNRTVAAIVTGAVVSTGTGIALVAGAAGSMLEIFGIVGGLTEVWLGVSILNLQKYVEIEHPVNVIDMIYENDNSERVFPVSVWNYINASLNEDEISKRERVVQRWEDFEVEVGTLEIIRSDGGKYNAEMLKTRANMLDQLEAQIYLMKQDLMLFTKFFYSLH
jgi:hypothetical protein